jgi:hypothetical protein
VKIGFNFSNWPILLLIFLFIAGRYLWGYFDHIDPLLVSEGARVQTIGHSLWCDLYTLQMPDGTYREAARIHWYFVPVFLGLAMMFKRNPTNGKLEKRHRDE